MSCKIPPLILQQDFKIILENETNKNSFNTTARRKKRSITTQGSIFQIVGSNGLDKADVYLGLQFDGFTAYQNISKVLPDTQFQFYPPPVIFSSHNIIYIQEYHPDPLIIQVKYHYIFRHLKCN